MRCRVYFEPSIPKSLFFLLAWAGLMTLTAACYCVVGVSEAVGKLWQSR